MVQSTCTTTQRRDHRYNANTQEMNHLFLFYICSKGQVCGNADDGTRMDGWKRMKAPLLSSTGSKQRKSVSRLFPEALSGTMSGIKLTHLHGVHTKTHKQRTQGFGTRRRIEWGVGGVYKRQQSKWLERVTNELQPNFEWTYTDFFLSASS